MADDVHTLASAMQAEMPNAWQEVKGEPFPGDPNDPDQQVIFLAIARGLLKYVNGRPDLIARMDIAAATVPTFNISNVKYNISGV